MSEESVMSTPQSSRPETSGSRMRAHIQALAKVERDAPTASDPSDPHALVLSFANRSEAEAALQHIQSSLGNGALAHLSPPKAQRTASPRKQPEGRVHRANPRHANLTLDKLRLSLSNSEGRQVSLQRYEALLLEAFTEAEDQALDFSTIHHIIDWPDDATLRNALYVRFIRLRKKLRELGAPKDNIKAVHGWGYQLCESIAVISAPRVVYAS